MATNPIYQYTWKTGWNNSGRVIGWPSIDAQKADLRQGIAKATLQKMVEKFAEVGHWLKVDSITVDITKYTTSMNYTTIEFQAEGQTTIVFQSDATLNQEFSPQGWEEFLVALVATIVLAIEAQPALFFILLIIVALTIFALTGGFKGVLFGAGGGGGAVGDIGTIVIVLAVLGIGAYVAVHYFGRKKGEPRVQTRQGRAYRERRWR
jgi:hypothetical protein